MGTQSTALAGVELASPQVIGMLKQAAQRGEVLYAVDDEGTEVDEVEISPECDDDNHVACDDEECECECHGDECEEDGDEEEEIDTDDDEDFLDDDTDGDGEDEDDE